MNMGTDILLENIALFDSGQPADLEGITITLVNLEEESALKNIRATQPNATGGMDLINPPIFLNLYLLFCANFPNNYVGALQHLSAIIRFFQVKNTFTISNSPNLTLPITGNEPEDLFKLKLSLKLYTPTFEQINHIWGALGGRQLPSVLYKAYLVCVYDRRTVKEGPPIEIIENNLESLENY
ncbi:MAG: DUF4255 domain-containing protein [Saprospirales bacterium]|nr:DUF4255 domain-containing protein [Saprospirales bacterium]